MLIYGFVLLATSLSPYNYKTTATYKSMALLMSGVVRNNFIFCKREEGVGGASSKLNHIFKQSFHISWLYLIWEEGIALKEINFL